MKTTYTAQIHPRAGFECVNAEAFHDGSSAAVTLRDASGVVCGVLVAGEWRFHVVQNKARTQKLTDSRRGAIAEACAALACYLSAEWHEAHRALYAD